MRSNFVSSDELNMIFKKLKPANKLACKIALQTGLRIDDVLSLKVEKIHERITVTEKKTGYKRRIFLGKKLLFEIKKFTGTKKEGYIFEHRLNPERHRTRQAVFKDIKKCCFELGISAQISPHSLRKAYAVRIYKRTKNLEKVQKILGHKKIETTLIYALSDVLNSKCP